MSQHDELSEIIEIDNRQLRKLYRDSIAIIWETKQNVVKLADDKADFNAMRQVSQRMNGFIGTFGFLEDNEQKQVIISLAEQAELLSEGCWKAEQALDEEKYDLLVKTVDTLLMTVETFRKNKELTTEARGNIDELLTIGSFLGVEDKEKLSQDSIDSMLDDFF